MFRKHFPWTGMALGLSIFLIFFKIYQHNLIIKLNYEKQRLEKKRDNCEKERNERLVVFSKLLDAQNVLTKARDEWGMSDLKVNQVIILSKSSSVDFIGTTSHSSVLQKLGLYDTAIGTTTERGHACTRL